MKSISSSTYNYRCNYHIFLVQVLAVSTLLSLSFHNHNSSCHAFTTKSLINNPTLTIQKSIPSWPLLNTKRMVMMDQGLDLDRFGAEEEDEELKPKQLPIRRQRRSKKVPLIAIVGRPNVGEYL